MLVTSLLILVVCTLLPKSNASFEDTASPSYPPAMIPRVVKQNLITQGEFIMPIGQGVLWPNGEISDVAYFNASLDNMTKIFKKPVDQILTVDSRLSHRTAVSAQISLSASAWSADVKVKAAAELDMAYSNSKIEFIRFVIKPLMEDKLKKCPKPSQTAIDLLTNKGEIEFRNKYGNYFVIGYQSMVRGNYKNVITTDSSDQKAQFGGTLGAQFKEIGGGTAGVEYANELKKVAERTNIYFSSSSMISSPSNLGNATNVFEWFDHDMNKLEFISLDKENVVLYPHSECEWYMNITGISKLPEILPPSEYIFNLYLDISTLGRSYQDLLKYDCPVVKQNLTDLDILGSYTDHLNNVTALIADERNGVSEGMTETEYEDRKKQIDGISTQQQNIIDYISYHYPLSCKLRLSPVPKKIVNSLSIPNRLDANTEFKYLTTLGDYYYYIQDSTPQYNLTQPYYACVYKGSDISQYDTCFDIHGYHYFGVQNAYFYDKIPAFSSQSIPLALFTCDNFRLEVMKNARCSSIEVSN